MEHIINFFILNKYKLSDYLKQVKVNQKKTVVKFESIAGQKLSITFFVYGEPQKKTIAYEDKVNRLFNTKEDLSTLDKRISEIDMPYYFSFGLGVKISKEDEPTIHKFQINIVFEKK